MKKMLLLLTAATLSFATAQAQTASPTPAPAAAKASGRPAKGSGRAERSPEQRADLQTQRLSKQLALSPDQQARVRPIFLAQATEMEALRGQRPSAPGDRQALGQKMKAIQTRTDEQLKSVLSAGQYTQYRQQLDRRHDKRQDARTGKVKMKTRA
ncbi:hypothetical protein [Hymenobacter sp. B81]|uniref:hypothetical protein n=1 Tax=Hymenobacter sp. B81 TaxID=3344878 RepID=UPI0037DD2E6D